MSQKLGKRTIELIDVTPALAKQWLAGNVANRDDRPKHAKRLARAMSQGEWVPTPEPIVFADHWKDPVTGQEYENTLTAGQHRLKAVVESGKTIQFVVVRNSDAAELAVMSQGLPWTQGDLLKATRHGIKHPTTTASVLASFARYALGYTDGLDTWMNRRMLDLIEPEIIQAVTYKLRLGGLVHRQFMAALLLAILIDPEPIEPFVKNLKNGTGIPFGDATRQIRDYVYAYITSRLNRDLPDVYFYKICNGIAAKLRGEPIKKLDEDPAGLAWLRDKASPKLKPIMEALFGGTPRGFYTPKPIREG